MTKQKSLKRSAETGEIVTVRRTQAIGTKVTTRLGNVSVSGYKPSRELVEANVDRSTQALERVGQRLTKPGVRLPDKKGVPRFSADENNPNIFIRRLNGKTTLGRLQNGQFVESK